MTPVPFVFPSTYRVIWYIDWPTPTSAAWWTIASTPRSASRRASASRMSPRTNSASVGT